LERGGSEKRMTGLENGGEGGGKILRRLLWGSVRGVRPLGPTLV